MMISLEFNITSISCWNFLGFTRCLGSVAGCNWVTVLVNSDFINGVLIDDAIDILGALLHETEHSSSVFWKWIAVVIKHCLVKCSDIVDGESSLLDKRSSVFPLRQRLLFCSPPFVLLLRIVIKEPL